MLGASMADVKKTRVADLRCRSELRTICDLNFWGKGKPCSVYRQTCLTQLLNALIQQTTAMPDNTNIIKVWVSRNYGEN